MKVDNGPDIGRFFVEVIFSDKFSHEDSEEWAYEYRNEELHSVLEGLVKEIYKSSFPTLEKVGKSWNLDRMYIVNAGHITDAEIENKTPVNFYFHVDKQGKVKTVTLEHIR
jgi:hypothetical protein